ncbi:dTDP-4-dehydrorhamnose reductase [Nakamurella panacisegetis]|uniref:dTDP-4-dehydrorhamnose reductase n=1 Tax=Nakamurella panacisegetis TaxID=1090615 RepID=A0A1H0PGP7_9ACTN|nr:dTDP-4-dehydrorhamnose reductase [Nakamurella panacisegetis]SDP04193.1 dTDP-4-dehydrorhamnose reductase [Nakamurella panacisegetis]
MSTPIALFVTGARGQLGSDLMAGAAEAGIPAIGAGSGRLDITDAAAVETALAEFAAGLPVGTRGIVVNCAAYTAVDAAETDESGAFAVNVTGPENLARSAAAHGLGMIHVSTDYVFPGDATSPYEVDDPTGPRSVYGVTKLAGEQAVRAAHPGAHVVRTAWVYGAGGPNPNFVKTMALLESKHDTITVVDDQRGSPTWSADLASGLLELAAADLPGGVLHATGGGETTWWGLARAVFAELGADPDRVRPTTSDQFVRPAPRPAYSVLSPAAWVAAGLSPLPPWRDALAAAFAAHGDEFRPTPPAS